MKIQCDVCNKDEASVYCVADEAALCNSCDHRVHHANKLARKHQRFSLLKPSPCQYPICDICQEKKAILFCQQDRAILCKDCDIPIHKANEHTKNHNRFPLTGLMLSPTSDIYTTSRQEEEHDLVPDFNKSQTFSNEPVSVVHKKITNPPLIPVNAKAMTSSGDEKVGRKSLNGTVNSQLIVSRGGCNGSMSSISEYLMENIPGWHVEDFLDSSNSIPFNGLAKTGENDMLPFWDDDLEGNIKSFSAENMGIWVPQAPTEMQPSPLYPTSNIAFGGQICFQEPKETAVTTNIKTNRKWRDVDGGFTVPEITPPSMFSKRSRTILL